MAMMARQIKDQKQERTEAKGNQGKAQAAKKSKQRLLGAATRPFRAITLPPPLQQVSRPTSLVSHVCVPPPASLNYSSMYKVSLCNLCHFRQHLELATQEAAKVGGDGDG